MRTRIINGPYLAICEGIIIRWERINQWIPFISSNKYLQRLRSCKVREAVLLAEQEPENPQPDEQSFHLPRGISGLQS